MTVASLLPFLLFAVVASVTPGPNNAVVLATAARRGLRGALPCMLGISLGFGFMVAVVGVGLAGPLVAHPLLHDVLRWLGAAWLLVLAWRIARAEDAPSGPGVAAAPGFLRVFWGMCGFQWVNPKAWILAVATSATYTVPDGAVRAQVLVLAGLFVVIGLFSSGSWALLGAGTGRWLSSPGRRRRFNLVMGVLLAGSVVPAVLD